MNSNFKKISHIWGIFLFCLVIVIISDQQAVAEKCVDTNDENKATHRHQIQFSAKNLPMAEGYVLKQKEMMRFCE